jgi:hypothetical protein
VARRLRIAVAARRRFGRCGDRCRDQTAEARHSLIDYKRMPAFARDLSALCAAIEGPLADADPGMGPNACSISSIWRQH